MQRLGFKDPTRAANNPGRSNDIDQRLHDWAIHNEKGIDVIIAGHTHRPVYENLSLTERRQLDSGRGTANIQKKGPDPAYYNTGSCVHPRCITGIEITLGQDKRPEFTLIKWAFTAQAETRQKIGISSNEYNLSVRRSVLEQGAANVLGRVYGEHYASRMLAEKISPRFEAFIKPYMQEV
ncbi:MAG: hypothetical protein H8E17_03635 [Deltaproteobacteria bacterium]|nr:hypothetical protein [Deltaproteobacteria bacterium]